MRAWSFSASRTAARLRTAPNSLGGILYLPSRPESGTEAIPMIEIPAPLRGFFGSVSAVVDNPRGDGVARGGTPALLILGASS